MQFKQELLVFPTSRSIRSYIEKQKDKNSLLPFCLTIDEFLKKSIDIENKKYLDEEEKFLYLKEAIKNCDLNKLGISSNFTSFLKQYEYIYRFFLELASEKVKLEDIVKVDTYEYYGEHLEILKQIKKNYLNLLEENSLVDKLNLSSSYKLNKIFFSRFKKIHIYFEGYFTKQEFDIIEELSKHIEIKISFYTYKYNKKSIELFSSKLAYEFKENHFYCINLSSETIEEESKNNRKFESLEIKAFSSRINQIAFIKHKITQCVEEGINPSNIALVLPDESFASSLQLFDKENYFNYAMGRNIKEFELYQKAFAIYTYLSEDENKFKENISYQKIDLILIVERIKPLWNITCKIEDFLFISDYIKSFEKSKELVEKYDELIYKLKILLFSNDNPLKLKEIFKIFIQKLSKLSLDDINSGKITVMGLLETRAVDFEVIMICDFNESFIPKTSVKDKFLSSKLKELAMLPTSFDRESLQKYYYKRLISSSKKVFISYVQSDSKQISRFANELFKDKIDERIVDNNFKHILYNNHSLVHFNGEIISKIDLQKFIWSATSLKTFLQCKRKFYLQYILKIREHELSLKPKAFELGDIIHSILEEYYTKNENTKELSYEKIEELFIKYKSNNAFLILDLEVWKRKLKEFFDYEKERLQYRKILAVEQKFELEFEGLKLKGFIDRIDKNDDTYEVIDYKTSSSLKVDTLKNYEKSNDFQLEFYYLAVNDLYKSSNIKTYYYDLNNTKLLEETVLDNKLELLMEKFTEIKELSKEEITFSKCEEKSVCQFCSYKIICNKE